ncbi:IclR family transcriptional regulator [Pseudolysinimonas kribbensis]|uniref:Transcriptional regulator n=1 Tax=Pseudolysinimonas kribbensis TaxID=433641 RepID=A0ABQ6K5S7_9MICO|nr:IclR family transcriptional regulator [Pseudolysinimonas kribbensis]GMA94779.1 transcriptional regulator [Pseudolysinimonas kribbensis]
MEQAGSYHSQGLSRALAVLRVLAGAEHPLTLSQLAQELDVPKSTLVRLLAVMQEEGFVRRYGDPPTFAIGHVVHEIAQAYRPPSVAEIAAPVMRRLAEEVGFTANLGVLRGRSVLHLHVEEPQRALRFAASGMLDDTYCTGLGKMLLSALPLDQVAASVPETEPYESWTPQTITTRAQLDAELERIRASGVSLDDEERNRGVSCMAVLLPGVHVSISVSGPTGELTPRDQRRILPVLRASAAEIVAAPGFVTALPDLPA